MALALTANEIGKLVPEHQAGMMLGLVTIAQILTVGLLVWLASRTDSFTAWLLGIPTALWTLWCGFVASMMFSGVWL